MARQEQKRRKTSDGKVLRENEMELASGLFCFRYKDIWGNRKQVTASTLQKLREKEKDILAKVESGIDISGGKTIDLNTCFTTVINQREKLGKVSPLTKENYVSAWNRAVFDNIGKMKVSAIKPAHLVQLFIQLTTPTTEGGKGYSKNTNKLIYGLLNMAFQFAVNNNYVDKSPTAAPDVKDAKNIGTPKVDHTALTPGQVNRLLEFVENSIYNQYYGYLMFAFFSGLRVSEQCGLTWDNVDDNYIYVNHQVQYKVNPETGKTEYIPTDPKTEAGNRKIKLTDEAREALHYQKKINFARYGSAEYTIGDYTGFIFTTKTGTPYTAAKVNFFLKNLINAFNRQESKKAEKENRKPELLPHLSSHDLRHTCITLRIYAGDRPKDVQAEAGHSKSAITMDIYTHALEDEQNQRGSNLGEYLNKAR